ncbi:hypothetical protein [Roseivirga thermotolerans]|uniref:hypothetical protein n=1 Tax=Roseivirga thermotolerans TaxID=1758176 RepID=UPI00273ECBB8|nr:hypothetical protein [Roseivirga thermotolerans]
MDPLLKILFVATISLIAISINLLIFRITRVKQKLRAPIIAVVVALLYLLFIWPTLKPQTQKIFIKNYTLKNSSLEVSICLNKDLLYEGSINQQLITHRWSKKLELKGSFEEGDLLIVTAPSLKLADSISLDISKNYITITLSDIEGLHIESSSMKPPWTTGPDFEVIEISK